MGKFWDHLTNQDVFLRLGRHEGQASKIVSWVRIGFVDAARRSIPAGEQSKFRQKHLVQERETHELVDMVRNGADGLALSALFAYNIIPCCYGESC